MRPLLKSVFKNDIPCILAKLTGFFECSATSSSSVSHSLLPVHAIKLSYLVITSFSETLRSKMSEEDFNINNISTTVPVIVFAKSQQVEDINEVEKIRLTFPSVIMRGLGLGHLLCGLLAISFQVPSA